MAAEGYDRALHELPHPRIGDREVRLDEASIIGNDGSKRTEDAYDLSPGGSGDSNQSAAEWTEIRSGIPLAVSGVSVMR